MQHDYLPWVFIIFIGLHSHNCPMSLIIFLNNFLSSNFQKFTYCIVFKIFAIINTGLTSISVLSLVFVRCALKLCWIILLLIIKVLSIYHKSNYEILNQIRFALWIWYDISFTKIHLSLNFILFLNLNISWSYRWYSNLIYLPFVCLPTW